MFFQAEITKVIDLQEKCDRCQETTRKSGCGGPRMLGGNISACIVCKKGKKPCSFAPAAGSRAAPLSVGDDVVVPRESRGTRAAAKRARSPSPEEEVEVVAPAVHKRVRRAARRSSPVAGPSSEYPGSSAEYKAELARLEQAYLDSGLKIHQARLNHVRNRAALADHMGIPVTDI